MDVLSFFFEQGCLKLCGVLISCWNKYYRNI